MSQSITGSIDCIVTTDHEIMGLGVRLGIYFQLASSLALYQIRRKEAIASILVSNMLMTGFLTSVIYAIIRNEFPAGAMIPVTYILALDACLLYPFLTGVGEVVYISSWTYTFTIFRANASAGLGCWLWFHGLDVQNESQCMEPRAFFFANVGALGNWRTVFRTFSVLALLMLIVVNDLPLIVMLRQCISRRSLGYEERWRISNLDILSTTSGLLSCNANAHVEPPAENLAMKPNSIQRGVVQGACLLFLWILAAELCIKWNKLAGVGSISSSGEIISFTVGTVSLVRVIGLAAMGDRNTRETEDAESQFPEELELEDQPTRINRHNTV